MIVRTPEQWQGVLTQIRMGPKHLVLDVETTGLRPWHGDQIVGMSLLVFRRGSTPESYYASFRSEVSPNLPISCLQDLQPFLLDEQRLLIGHNIKFDLHFLEQTEGLTIGCAIGDSMVAAHLANENEPSLKLENIAKRYYGGDADKFERECESYLKGLGFKKKGEDEKEGWWKRYMAYVPVDILAHYAENDVWLAWGVFRMARESVVESEKLPEIFTGVMRYSEICRRMESRGVLIDPVVCQQMGDNAVHEKERLLQEIASICGKEVNPLSVPQVRETLGQHETDRQALSICEHPAAPLIDQYRRWDKFRSAYSDPYLSLRDSENRIHANIKVTGTISSRLAISKPPLQALAKDDRFFGIKKVIVAPPGYVLFSADYNQAELRMLTYYTQDPFLIHSYREGLDIHQETAEMMGISRDRAKTLNFSIVYGIGAPGISKKWGIPLDEAKDILSRYHSRIPGIKRLYRECEKHAEFHRYIPLWTGRRRHYGPGTETHKAMSNLIQGGVAEIARVAMSQLAEEFRGSDAHMILQVHDEIIGEMPEEETDFWMPRILEILQDFNFDNVKIVADAKVGKTLGDMHSWIPSLKNSKSASGLRYTNPTVAVGHG